MSILIIIIFKKQVVRQAVKDVEENTKILAIFNKYKDTFDDFINSSDEQFQDWPQLIDKESYKAPRFKSSLRALSKEENISDES